MIKNEEDVKANNNNMSLQSSSSSKRTDFTFCKITNLTEPHKDEHPFLSSPPSFNPIGYSSYNSSSTKARNKIFELMSTLPESYQELSLRDIVIDDLGKQRSMVDQNSVLKTGLKDQKTRPISRSVSLDTGVFMLKMLNPISCGTKKSRSTTRMRSKNDSLGSSDKSKKRCMPPNTKSRSAEFVPGSGCWFINKPWKATRQRGCIV